MSDVCGSKTSGTDCKRKMCSCPNTSVNTIWTVCAISDAELLMSYISCSLQNPAIADIYTEHAHPVTVAKYAPSGFYIASGGKQPT